MTEESKRRLPYPFPAQDPGQYQIQGGNPVIETASRYPQKRDIPHIGNQEHGPGKRRRPVVDLCGAGKANAVACHIIRIDTHSPTQKE